MQTASVIDRVKSALGASTLDEVADRLQERRPTVGSWSARKSVPLDALVKVAAIANCSLDWLVLGDAPAAAKARAAGTRGGALFEVVATLAKEEPPPWLAAPGPFIDGSTQLRGASGKPADEGNSDAALLGAREARAVRPLVLSLPEGEEGGPGEDYEVIPKHRRPALAGVQSGRGSDQGEGVTLIGELAFSFDWMRRNLGHTTGRLSSVQVRGNSMATTLLDGETIIIDEGINTVEVDDIYVLDVYGRRLVKRVQHLVDGTLVLISDNPSYQRESIPRDLAREVQVIGRMVWPRVR